MLEFWNFKDSWFLVQQNLPWVALAFFLGCFWGWYSCDARKA